MPGLLRALILAVIVLCAGTADAQVFKPRGKTPSTRPAPGALAKASPAAAAAKTPTRPVGPTPRRVVTTTPAAEKAPARKGKGKKGKDDVSISDDDDEDVQIKDE